MLNWLGLVSTIEDEENAANAPSDFSGSDEEGVRISKKKKTLKKKKTSSADFNEEFQFEDRAVDDLVDEDIDVGLRNHVQMSTLDEKIRKLRKQRILQGKSVDDGGMDEVAEFFNEQPNGGKDLEGEDMEVEDISSGEDVEPSKTDKIKVREKKHKKKKNKKDFQNSEADEIEEKVQYKEEVTTYTEVENFNDMNLSRPLMKALTALGWTKPTPIQTATIPVALLGKDICACAATGTGKTGAFMLPVLERLLYKPKQMPVTRVLVLTPTRELAVQIYQVSCHLVQFTNIDVSLSAGGLDVKAQEAALRLGPDVVIATPGRLIDHIHNTPNFSLQSVEVLVLDEADRMLDEYFAEQMKEVLRLCSRSRQTMLFSATMTEQVKDLAAVSLNNPVKVFVNENKDVAYNLRQEFIRIRENHEGDREAIVAALIKRTFHDHCMVFIQTKKHAHRMHIILGLLGVKVGELHGNLTQAQRLEALRQFKNSEVDVLMATDLAARGLDIDGVKIVINFTMPNSLEHYIHRVGRTARAGKSGRSVTLVGEKERKLLREVVKRANLPVKSRVVPADVIQKYRERIDGLEKDVREIGGMEAEEKEMRVSELKANKAQKMIDHREEIMSRPKRTWFQTHQQRLQEKAAQRLTKLEVSRKQKTRQTLSAADRVEYDLQKSAAFAARAAKKQNRDKRVRACVDDDTRPVVKKPKKVKKSSFSKELTSTGSSAVRKFRSMGSSTTGRGTGGKFPGSKKGQNHKNIKGRRKRK